MDFGSFNYLFNEEFICGLGRGRGSVGGGGDWGGREVRKGYIKRGIDEKRCFGRLISCFNI